jgi:hypothetical protein
MFDTDNLGDSISGGEGSVYVLNSKSRVKIYHQDQLNEQRQRKVMALLSLRPAHRRLLGDRFAMPRAAVQDAGTKVLVGFEMQNFANVVTLGHLAFNQVAWAYPLVKGEAWINEERSGKLVFDLFFLLDSLHLAGIIVGDLKPDNILFDCTAKAAVFVDMDSVTLGGGQARDASILSFVYGAGGPKLSSLVLTPEYLDPVVLQRGCDAEGNLQFTSSGDYYAMAIITYEHLVGSPPHFIKCRPPQSEKQNKAIGASLLGHSLDPGHLASRGIVYWDCPGNRLVLKRIEEVRVLHPEIYRFLVDTLVKGRRKNLLTYLDVSDPRHPACALINGSANRRAEEPAPPPPPPPGMVLRKLQLHVLNPGDIWELLTSGKSKGRDPGTLVAFIRDAGFDLKRITEYLAGGAR